MASTQVHPLAPQNVSFIAGSSEEQRKRASSSIVERQTTDLKAAGASPV